MKLGIFGGSFNPPHKAHLNIAEDFLTRLGLDRVYVIPTYIPPHKQADSLASCSDRYNMCRLLFTDERFTVSDMEIQRGGKSYSVDTLTEIKKEHPDDEIYMIIGSDMLLSFDKWYRYEDILKLCTLCVATREDEVTVDIMKKYARDVLDLGEGEIIFSFSPAYEMSSTLVRSSLESSSDVSEYLTGDVEKYIKDRELYQKGRYDEIKELLRQRLDDYRYIHSLGVADMAQKLAANYGENEDRAYLAGLVHDITKNTPKNVQLQIIREGGIILSPEEQNNPKLWHAISGSVYVRQVMKLDEDTASAVRYHTTGKSNMTLLEKIIYIADYISRERSFNGVEFMRKLAFESLDKAALYALDFGIPDLVKKRSVLHIDSVRLYNELVMKGINYTEERNEENDS